LAGASSPHQIALHFHRKCKALTDLFLEGAHERPRKREPKEALSGQPVKKRIISEYFNRGFYAWLDENDNMENGEEPRLDPRLDPRLNPQFWWVEYRMF